MAGYIGHPMTIRSSRTALTPIPIHAASITMSCSAQVATWPVSVTVPSLAPTSISLVSSISAYRSRVPRRRLASRPRSSLRCRQMPSSPATGGCRNRRHVAGSQLAAVPADVKSAAVLVRHQHGRRPQSELANRELSVTWGALNVEGRRLCRFQTRGCSDSALVVAGTQGRVNLTVVSGRST